MTNQKWYAPEINPVGTTTTRQSSGLLHTIPVRARDSASKIAFEFSYKLAFNDDTNYKILFFDFASQELLFAALLSQAYNSNLPFGTDPFLNAILTGNKMDGTDLYSLTAKVVNIKRNEAKGAVLATMYGCGITLFTSELLKGVQDENQKPAVKAKAKLAYEKLKGKQDLNGKFIGGVASGFFNYCARNNAQQIPIMPIFRQNFPKSLSPKYISKISPTTAINYNVQASCATAGMLSAYIAFAQQQFEEAGLTNLDARYAVSVHDCLAYLVKDTEENIEKTAMCMIRAYTQVWALVISQLGMKEFPVKLIEDIVIDVSSVWRKNAFASIETPGFKYDTDGYQIMADIATGGLKYGQFAD